MPQPRIRLVVTGDDFGYCPRRNRGIVECFLSGAVSNVSLLVNAGSAKDGAELARRYSIPIGLHANLSEGLPICEQLRKGSSLVNHKGYFHGKMGFRKALWNGQLNMAEVELELRAQVTLFCDLTGHLPHHMDGHQHVHILPGVREVFACVMSDCRIRFTRVPLEPGLQACSWLPLHLRDFYTQVQQDARESVGVFLKHGIRWPDVYIGLTTMGRNMSVARIKTAISHALETPPAKENGMTSHRPELALVSGLSERDHVLTMELMVHPGYPSLPLEGGCGEGPDDFSQSSDRQHEMETLKDPRLLTFYKEKKIQLCAFKDL